ncbi:Peptidase S9, prolyl oligopeptidase, catalytic domain protein [Metarhizium album ARSEF 1941]|uniref:Peptidase S9, prolyl oligopeptidase, catalytic domain protein n=1 Tax=Metarhizium album (strain ARSEF 1941) TaxID=1081103 RepID=A0A0B2WLX9_METAS|nr:Peptidase S9, prolyl oligopeptidase, catalytic domain protein [Metarhizium album ARSEF 1941]KHN94669.1 Peptidase S9, prolyl oligopeptidase, catalytic domain protein [Metarhizium album ARSEF 1941]
MTLKRVAPYGSWVSPIGVKAAIFKNRALTCPRVNVRLPFPPPCHTRTRSKAYSARRQRKSGRSFFVESTPEGRQTIVEITKDDGLRDVLPRDYSVQNRVYEYGGSLCDVLPDDRLIFSHEDDTVRLLSPDSGQVQLVVRSNTLRYSSFCARHPLPWVLAIEEDHASDDPYEVQNYIVAINVENSTVQRVVSGADFYYLPQFSFDGAQVSWVEWDHPDLPFAAANLYVGDWTAQGSVKNARLIAGQNHESVAEPRWGPDGSLFYAKETGPYRKLYRVPPDGRSEELIPLEGLDDAEFAQAGLMEGSRTFVPLTADMLVATAVINGISRLIAVDITTGSWKMLGDEEHLCDISGDAVARLGHDSVLAIGSGTVSHKSVYKIDVADPRNSKVIRRASDEQLPDETYARPETVHMRSTASPSRDIFGFLWMPQNPDYTAPSGELPPLIIHAHGGPTGRKGSGLSLRTQYFTSRGYAYLALNYTGSTGYGRQYRESLFGNWGIVDAADAAEAADYMAASGRVDRDAVGITGISAGGYNTLQSLSRYPAKFAGGVCVAGISELSSFDKTTHKLESDYTAALVLHPGVSEDEKRKIFRERSALCHVADLKSPLLLLHGQADTVVPVQQARIMAEALKELHRDVEILEVEDEGHMFAKPSSAELWLVQEEAWWKKTLLQKSRPTSPTTPSPDVE